MSLLMGRRLSRWSGTVIQFLGVPLVHGIVPWALSLVATRHGWTDAGPGLWNVAGLAPVIAGFSLISWAIVQHFASAPRGWLIEKTPHYPTPAYLLVDGPYRFSRNPIYLAELLAWAGWIVFYGSIAVLSVFVMALIIGPIFVRREERGLAARFGETYREYERTVPRWFGRGRLR